MMFLMRPLIRQEVFVRAEFSSKGHGGLASANVGLVLSAFVLALLFAEIGIRLFAPQPMIGTPFEYASRGYTINKSNGTALFSVGNSKGIYSFTPPHLRGMRQPPPDTERILVLGDSFTFGVGLSDQDTYVAKLQEKIDSAFGADRIALLNGGIGGSGTAEHLAFLEDFGDEIAPRIVLLFVNVEDFNRAQQSSLYHLHSNDGLELDEGIIPITPLNKLFRKVTESDIYNFAIQHVQIVQLIRRVFIRVVFQSKYDAKSDLSIAGRESKSTFATPLGQQRLVHALFRRMKAWCDAHGARLAVINNRGMSDEGWRQYDWLPKLLAVENITAFDSAPQIQSMIAGDPVPFVITQGVGHPNAKGAAVIAEVVWPFIQSFIRENQRGCPRTWLQMPERQQSFRCD
jgi:lysophospholipase L1-like esterase